MSGVFLDEISFGRKEGRNEMFYLTTHSKHILFTVIWRHTYG